jgi:peptide/nickel transport system ATP-binding protein
VTAVDVDNLTVVVADTGAPIVENVRFAIGAGEVLGLVGESGSGKTTVANAMLGDARRGARIEAGSIGVAGTEILRLDRRRLRRLRGATISYIPQDPATALNPGLRLKTQFREIWTTHGWPRERGQPIDRLRDLLEDVNLPASDDFLSRYPHELSGGQQQRVCIAMAFLLEPRFVVLDEPTTGLDVSTQARVLRTVRDLCESRGVAALYVSHDLAVVHGLADRVMVMYAGETVELGPTHEVFERPAHPYTSTLLEAIPDVRRRIQPAPIPGQAPAPGWRPAGCAFAPRCRYAAPVCQSRPDIRPVSEVHQSRCHRPAELERRLRPTRKAAPPPPAVGPATLSVRNLHAAYGNRSVLHDVSLELRAGECLALVGESGSGKTTLGRVVVGLLPPTRGTIAFEGELLAGGVEERMAGTRRRLQYVFQNPYASLNPRRTIADTLRTPVRHFFGVTGPEATERITGVLATVGLPVTALDRYPSDLSGGERQRVAIARALVCEPTTLICDEITSALDVSVQAAVIELLAELRSRDDLALLFVTHNLALVRAIADRVAVMQAGRIVETGPSERVLEAPGAAYTRSLLDDTPRFAGDPASP